jgi:hypothetical protein
MGKLMAMGYINGKMARSMMGSGRRELDMVRVFGRE